MCERDDLHTRIAHRASARAETMCRNAGVQKGVPRSFISLRFTATARYINRDDPRHRATPGSFYGRLKSLILENDGFPPPPTARRGGKVAPRDTPRRRRTEFNRIEPNPTWRFGLASRERPYLSISRGTGSLCSVDYSAFASIRPSAWGARNWPRLRQMTRKSRGFPTYPPSVYSPPPRLSRLSRYWTRG